jgi:hypothetical protein
MAHATIKVEAVKPALVVEAGSQVLAVETVKPALVGG